MTYTQKRSLTFATIFILCGSLLGFWWITQAKDEFKIVPFVYERDAQDIFDMFDKNWYWLMPTPKETYSPHYLPYVFKYRAPSALPMNRGLLQVHVIRQNNKVIAFTAFYKKSKTVGQLLFVAVDSEFRKKGLGEKLVAFALDALKKQDIETITLITRTDNLSAQRLYTRSGFQESHRDGEGFMYFSYTI